LEKVAASARLPYNGSNSSSELILCVKGIEMNIEGTYTFQSKLTEIRQSLTRQEALQQAIPGLEQLEPLENNRYNVAIHIKYPPLVGTYQGLVSFVEDQQSASYRLLIESNGSPNTLTGVGSIQLHEFGENTTVFYKGTLTISKRGVRLTPAVTKGALKLLIQQFFTSLSDQLRMDHTGIVEEDGNTAVDVVPFHSPPAAPEVASSFIHKIVRWLGLGKANALQEEIWAERIRQIGLVSGFLFLVWIGTRLARKK
jgi:carbon monoxide dehydrogenase subunit G